MGEAGHQRNVVPTASRRGRSSGSSWGSPACVNRTILGALPWKPLFDSGCGPVRSHWISTIGVTSLTRACPLPCTQAPYASRPQTTAVVWRYMPWERLLDMLTTAELYLRRLDHLTAEDPAEGRWLEDVGTAIRFTVPQDGWGNLIAALEAERTRTYVNCWTLRRNEHAAMWQRYESDSLPTAVSTSYGDLMAALSDATHELYLGGVYYCDRVEDFVRRFPRVNTLNLAFAKRRQFSWEQEVRLVCQVREPSSSEVGVRIPIDLQRLGLCVWLPPNASRDHADRVKDALQHRDLACEVRSSDL